MAAVDQPWRAPRAALVLGSRVRPPEGARPSTPLRGCGRECGPRSLHQADQRPTEEAIDLDVEASQDLEPYLRYRGRNAVAPGPCRRGAPQPGARLAGCRRVNHAEGLRQFQVRQIEERLVASSPTLANTSPKRSNSSGSRSSQRAPGARHHPRCGAGTVRHSCSRRAVAAAPRLPERTYRRANALRLAQPTPAAFEPR